MKPTKDNAGEFWWLVEGNDDPIVVEISLSYCHGKYSWSITTQDGRCRSLSISLRAPAPNGLAGPCHQTERKGV